MGLGKRGKRWWGDFWVAGRRRRESSGLTDKRAAEEWYRRRRAELERDHAEGPDPLRDHARAGIEAHLADFAAHLRAKRVSEHHLAQRLGHLRSFLEFAGVKRLADLDPVGAERWLAAEARKPGKGGKPLSARSLNRRRASLKHFSRWLVTARRAAWEAFGSLSALNEDSDRRLERRAPTALEEAALLEASPFERGVIYALAMTTGLRRSELAALTWAEVDLERGAVTTRAAASKNRREALLPLHPSARAGLVELLRRRQAGETTRGAGRYATPEPGAGPGEPVFNAIPTILTYRRDLDRAGVAFETPAGVLDFHALRGGFATSLQRAGVGLTQTQRLMRHSSPALTSKVYSKLDLGDARGAVDRLGGGWTLPESWGAACPSADPEDLPGECDADCVGDLPSRPTTLQLRAGHRHKKTALSGDPKTPEARAGRGLQGVGGSGTRTPDPWLKRPSGNPASPDTPEACAGPSEPCDADCAGSASDPQALARELLALASSHPNPLPLLEAARALLATPAPPRASLEDLEGPPAALRLLGPA